MGESSGLLPGHVPFSQEVAAAPVLGLPGVTSWRVVLLENRPGHHWQKFDLGRWAISLPPLHRRGCRFLRHLFEVAVGRDGLSAGDDVQIGELAAILTVGRLENLEGRLIG